MQSGTGWGEEQPSRVSVNQRLPPGLLSLPPLQYTSCSVDKKWLLADCSEQRRGPRCVQDRYCPGQERCYPTAPLCPLPRQNHALAVPSLQAPVLGAFLSGRGYQSSFFLISVVRWEVRRWSVSRRPYIKWSHTIASFSRAQWNCWVCVLYEIVYNGMRWGVGGEATDTSWNMANSGFVKGKYFYSGGGQPVEQVAQGGHDISILGAAQNRLGKAPLLWTGGWAGTPADPCPPPWVYKQPWSNPTAISVTG